PSWQMATPKVSGPALKICLSAPGRNVTSSSEGSSCTLSCHPRREPSGPITSTEMRRSSPTKRSVPSTTATFARAAAAATAGQAGRARRRKGGRGGRPLAAGERSPGQEARGEAAQPRLGAAGAGDGVLGGADRGLRRLRERQLGEGDAEKRHGAEGYPSFDP